MTYLVDGGELVEVKEVSPRAAALQYCLYARPFPPIPAIDVYLMGPDSRVLDAWRFAVEPRQDVEA